ncbi:MAG: hypothetical protein UV19_C0011G0015 [Parcubacteria group bacterium GW2011_GWA2_42_28]|nr:MAG: hypothetical protein UV19_C0011G0015 [Parcubacteria group bacterium GW2011_GWA2_42_28]KKT53823.1 MAG: hypothetical protein UW45_C0025G0015 [Parcubacteria group bacterium GW2011_GWC2_44_22]
MVKLLKKIIHPATQPEKLDPNKPDERKRIIKRAVERTVREYGEALKKLGSD